MEAEFEDLIGTAIASEDQDVEHLCDVRVSDTDHLIIFRHPALVAQLVLEALGRTT
jgi:hypothetical protein